MDKAISKNILTAGRKATTKRNHTYNKHSDTDTTWTYGIDIVETVHCSKVVRTLQQNAVKRASSGF
jgi:hypothetical protein